MHGGRGRKDGEAPPGLQGHVRSPPHRDYRSGSDAAQPGGHPGIGYARARRMIAKSSLSRTVVPRGIAALAASTIANACALASVSVA